MTLYGKVVILGEERSMKRTVEKTTIHIGRKMTFKTSRVLDGSNESIIDYVDCRLGSVAVVAVDKHGKIVLEKNRRYPVGNRIVIEIPAGHLKYGEDPSECAKREIEEETGYVTESIRNIGWAYSSPGHSNEIIQLFFATLRSKGKSKLQPGEDIKLLRMTVGEVLNLLIEGKLHDMKTIAGILISRELGLV